MRGNRLSLPAAVSLVIAALLTMNLGAAAQEKALHSFGGSGMELIQWPA
jgi:hypothetical protein